MCMACYDERFIFRSIFTLVITSNVVVTTYSASTSAYVEIVVEGMAAAAK